MIGTSTFDYLFIRLCISGLHSIAPLSTLYCLVQVLLQATGLGTPPRLPLLLEIWLITETAFYLLHQYYRHYLQSQALHPPAPSRAKRRQLFNLCNANIPDYEVYLQKWFLGAPANTIKQDNMKEFFLWAFFNREGLPGEDDEELVEYIRDTEHLLGRKIAPGRGSARCLRPTLDEVKMLHRSVLWYICVGFVDFLTFARLLQHGFHFHRTALSRFFTLFPFRPVAITSRKISPASHLSYWHRPHTSKNRLPVLFIHGIGIGLYPYVDFLADLNSEEGLEDSSSDDQVGIIAIEIMPVSFRITYPALAKEVICEQIHSILQYHGWERYVLVSHSYGSAISTHLLKTPQTANLIGPVVLIDPITLLLHLPDVAYNFTRRLPMSANEHQLYYFASMDPGVGHALGRMFFWSDCILWKEDLGDRRVTVSLAERDLIVNTEAVGNYLASAGAKPRHENGHIHGTEMRQDKRLHGDGGVRRRMNRAEEGRGAHTGNSTTAWKHRPWRGRGIDVLWQEDLDHAQVFDSRQKRKTIIRAIKEYCDEPREVDSSRR